MKILTLGEVYNLLGDRRCLDADRLEKLYDAAVEASALDGEFWECGTFKGGSARLLAEVLRNRPRPLRLFDTFGGFANVSTKDKPEDWGHLVNGAMCYDNVEDVRAFVAADFVEIYPGPVPTRFPGLEGSKIAFANLDMDLYQPTKAALDFILPRLVKGGIIVIDDCGAKEYPGVETAVTEAVGMDGFKKTSRLNTEGTHIVWQGQIRR
jgi:O-methyltransferase